MVARVLFGLVVIVVVVWLVAYLTGAADLRRELRAPWPYELGSVEQLRGRRPPPTSPEAQRILQALGSVHRVDSAWLAVQVTKKNDDIDPLVETIDEARVAELTRLVLVADTRIQWGTRAPAVPDAVALLGVAALEHAHNGNADLAWDNVRAMWILARSVTRGFIPMYSRLRALEMERLANAVARKLPPPVPSWTTEMEALDPRRDAAAALQTDASFVSQTRRLRGAAVVIGFLFRPLLDRVLAKNVREIHTVADAMTARRCRVDPKVIRLVVTRVPVQIAYRAARFDAEGEATAKILALKRERARNGRWPALVPGITDSRCADNSWQYRVSPDGSRMMLQMSLLPAYEPNAELTPQLAFAY